MTQQLELLLTERKAPPRQRPITERLLQLVQRAGVQTSRDATKGRVMFRPYLARPYGSYQDHCSNWNCQDRWRWYGINYSYGNKAEAKRQAKRGGSA